MQTIGHHPGPDSALALTLTLAPLGPGSPFSPNSGAVPSSKEAGCRLSGDSCSPLSKSQTPNPARSLPLPFSPPPSSSHFTPSIIPVPTSDSNRDMYDYLNVKMQDNDPDLIAITNGVIATMLSWRDFDDGGCTEGYWCRDKYRYDHTVIPPISNLAYSRPHFQALFDTFERVGQPKEKEEGDGKLKRKTSLLNRNRTITTAAYSHLLSCPSSFRSRQCHDRHSRPITGAAVLARSQEKPQFVMFQTRISVSRLHHPEAISLGRVRCSCPPSHLHNYHQSLNEDGTDKMGEHIPVPTEGGGNSRSVPAGEGCRSDHACVSIGSRFRQKIGMVRKMMKSGVKHAKTALTRGIDKSVDEKAGYTGENREKGGMGGIPMDGTSTALSNDDSHDHDHPSDRYGHSHGFGSAQYKLIRLTLCVQIHEGEWRFPMKVYGIPDRGCDGNHPWIDSTLIAPRGHDTTAPVQWGPTEQQVRLEREERERKANQTMYFPGWEHRPAQWQVLVERRKAAQERVWGMRLWPKREVSEPRPRPRPRPRSRRGGPRRGRGEGSGERGVPDWNDLLKALRNLGSGGRGASTGSGVGGAGGRYRYRYAIPGATETKYTARPEPRPKIETTPGFRVMVRDQISRLLPTVGSSFGLKKAGPKQTQGNSEYLKVLHQNKGLICHLACTPYDRARGKDEKAGRTVERNGSGGGESVGSRADSSGTDVVTIGDQESSKPVRGMLVYPIRLGLFPAKALAGDSDRFGISFRTGTSRQWFFNIDNPELLRLMNEGGR